MIHEIQDNINQPDNVTFGLTNLGKQYIYLLYCRHKTL